jgi:hypothetical protein
MERLQRGLLFVLVGVLVAAAAPTARATVAYGISDARGAFSTYYDTPAFTSLQARMNSSGHPLAYARFFVAWDAIDVWDGQRCVVSPALLAGGNGWGTLVGSLREAQTRGLIPLVAIVEGTGIGGAPSIPTDEDYVCGLRALMRATTASGLHVPAWEVFNEPDSHVFPLDSHGVSGADAAAWLYVDAATARGGAGTFDSADTLVAGSFNGGTLNPNHQLYAHEYFDYLTQILGAWPDTWSFHPYDDVTASYASPQAANTHELASFIEDRYAGRPQPQIWLTEEATNIRTTTTTYNGMPVHCVSGDPGETDQLGGCVDGNPTAQANAAVGFLDLPAGGSAFPGEITRAYWYEFRPVENWDSGLLSPDGALRQSYCVLAALPGTACNDTAHEHSDYTDWGPGASWDTTH